MEKRNFRMVLQLLNEAEVHADGSPSDLDRRFRRLDHWAVRSEEHTSDYIR